MSIKTIISIATVAVALMVSSCRASLTSGSDVAAYRLDARRDSVAEWQSVGRQSAENRHLMITFDGLELHIPHRHSSDTPMTASHEVVLTARSATLQSMVAETDTETSSRFTVAVAGSASASGNRASTTVSSHASSSFPWFRLSILAAALLLAWKFLARLLSRK